MAQFSVTGKLSLLHTFKYNMELSCITAVLGPYCWPAFDLHFATAWHEMMVICVMLMCKAVIYQKLG